MHLICFRMLNDFTWQLASIELETTSYVQLCSCTITVITREETIIQNERPVTKNYIKLSSVEWLGLSWTFLVIAHLMFSLNV